MSEKKAQVLAIILFTMAAILLFFAPAWSASDRPGGEEGGVRAAGAMVARLPGSAGRIVLPLKRTEVHLEVTAGVVSAEVTQLFTNETPSPLEAVYVFPLPSRASVTGMELRTADRIVRSIVQEKQAARRTYAKARKAGKKTALLEQERPNIFTTSIANFLPGETLEVRLSYMEPAEYRRGVYDVSFPMVVGQRYIPKKLALQNGASAAAVSTVADADRLNPPLLHPAVDSGHRLSLTAEIHGMAIDEISSNTHAIDVRRPGRGSRSAYVTLSRGGTVPDKDFSMSIHLEKNADPSASLVVSKTGGTAHAMLSVFPPTEDKAKKKAPSAREVIFLIDTSGSMKGSSIGQAKAGLNLCLDMLRPEDHFTIVRFANHYSSFTPDLREATPERVQSARGYVQGLSANGGTEMQKALSHVLTLPGKGRGMRIVVFLTDGAVGNEHSLMRLLETSLGDTRMFAFAIGSAPNEYLIRKMSEYGRGQARFIRSHEDIGVVMSDFFRTLTEPVLTDVRLSWEGESVDEEIRFYPDPPPDVYVDRPLNVVMRYPEDAEGRLVVRGTRGGEEVGFSFPIRKEGGAAHQAIDKIFGRAAVSELMFRWVRGTAAEKRVVRREIVETALAYQLVSRFTSRVAVEEKVERTPDGTRERVAVRVPLPRGWSSAAFHPTATNDGVWFAGGLVLLLAAGMVQAGLRLCREERTRVR